jgi:hypothetical protein
VARGFETGKFSELSSLGDIRLRLDPEVKQVEIIDTGLAVAHPVDQVIAKRWRQARTSSPCAVLFPENKAAQLVAEFLDYLRVF